MVLLAMMVLAMLRVPSLKMPPPAASALLLEMVELVTVMVPPTMFAMPPP